MTTTFPTTFKDKEGHEVTVRLIKSSDVDGIFDLFQRIPPKWRQLIHEKVDSKPVLAKWLSRLNPEVDLPLVAIRDGKIVAATSLFRRNSGPLRHQGRLRFTVDTAVYPFLVGTRLVDEIVQFAKHTGLEGVTISLVEDIEAEEIDALVGLGFEKAATIPRYAKDMDGKLHGMVFLIHRLGR